MCDPRIHKLALILVDHSARIQPGDRVAIEATTAAEPLVSALYSLILERGGHPHLLLKFPKQDVIFFKLANDKQLAFIPTFRKLVYDTFESRIRIHSVTKTQAMKKASPVAQAKHQQALSPILEAQMKRGGEGLFKWVTTLFPTRAYAKEAGMTLKEFEDFVFQACHVDEETPNPAEYWGTVEKEQAKAIERIEGHDRVELRGPNVDLTLSIKGRKFRNASGQHNMPDGEIYTGPVEDSANGWVRYTYPASYAGRIAEGVQLTFENGKVVMASAQTNDDFLKQMLDTDVGSRYLGEFAIGTNYQIDRATKNILFDEKIGGSFHTALGAGYPETGSRNRSAIHWDLICDMKEDSEILVDGELVYQNGKFVF